MHLTQARRGKSDKRQRRPFHQMLPLATQAAIQFPFVLILHELLLDGPKRVADARTREVWHMNQQQVTIGFGAHCDVILPRPLELDGFLHMDTYFVLTLNEKNNIWVRTVPIGGCDWYCKIEDPHKAHEASVTPGTGSFDVCVGCGRPDPCCPDRTHPRFTFTVEMEQPEAISSNRNDLSEAIPGGLPPGWIDTSVPVPFLMRELLVRDSHIVPHILGTIKQPNLHGFQNMWDGIRFLHLVNIFSVDHLVAPRRPPNPDSLARSVFNSLVTSEALSSLKITHPEEMPPHEALKVTDLLKIDFEVEQPNEDLMVRLEELRFPSEVNKVMYTWHQKWTGELWEDLQPKALAPEELREILLQTTWIREADIDLPFQPNFWTSEHGLENLFGSLEKVGLTFYQIPDNNPTYPELSLFTQAVRLAFTSREEDGNHFLRWLFNNQAVLPQAQVLQLNMTHYSPNLMLSRRNWAKLKRTLPNLEKIRVQFQTTLEGPGLDLSFIKIIGETWMDGILVQANDNQGPLRYFE